MNPPNGYKRVYVWEQPVRWFHWINAVCVTVLAISCYLIAHPLGFLNGGEAAFSYWFGTVRFVHFLTAYLMLGNFLFRIYWASAGNKYANWRNFFPLTRRQLKQIWDVLKVDIFQSSDKVVHTLGHNSVAYFTYTGTGLLTLFQIVSGFALYAPTSSAWFPQLFTWIVPLFGSEQNLRLFHYAGMWAFVLFISVHVYLVFYHDYVEGHGVASSIIGGWKFMEKHQAEAEEATGISAFPERKPAPVHPAAKAKTAQ
ncbi:MAG TPA: Ni/Fe-hydrogenase, b-type cytochrome subunit [Candidatus Didemnitutus sp.]|nr:Ni/Fe-hydrogenase, b-type cytochrome subunit [Candidatus Didemnitutus sp.]